MIETAYGPNPNPLAQAPAVKPVAMPPMQRTLRVPNDRARGAFVENVFRPCDRRLLLRLLPQKRLEATFKGCAARLKRTLEAMSRRKRSVEIFWVLFSSDAVVTMPSGYHVEGPSTEQEGVESQAAQDVRCRRAWRHRP